MLASIPYHLQQQLVQLKLQYSQKKECLIKKLDMHQSKVENIFKIFYDALDQMRENMLQDEYSMRSKMDNFEYQTRALIKKMQTYSLIEFYHEEQPMHDRIQEL